jgi:hypothetical protein
MANAPPNGATAIYRPDAELSQRTRREPVRVPLAGSSKLHDRQRDKFGYLIYRGGGKFKFGAHDVKRLVQGLNVIGLVSENTGSGFWRQVTSDCQRICDRHEELKKSMRPALRPNEISPLAWVWPDGDPADARCQSGARCGHGRSPEPHSRPRCGQNAVTEPTVDYSVFDRSSSIITFTDRTKTGVSVMAEIGGASPKH